MSHHKPFSKSASRDITSGRVHRDVCWIGQSSYLVDSCKPCSSIRHTSLVIMANHTLTYWCIMGPLTHETSSYCKKTQDRSLPLPWRAGCREGWATWYGGSCSSASEGASSAASSPCGRWDPRTSRPSWCTDCESSGRDKETHPVTYRCCRRNWAITAAWSHFLGGCSGNIYRKAQPWLILISP